MLGLSCGTQDLRCGVQDLLVAACGLLVLACELLVMACMCDPVPRPRIEPRRPVLGAQSLSQWTTREVPNWIEFWGLWKCSKIGMKLKFCDGHFPFKNQKPKWSDRLIQIQLVGVCHNNFKETTLLTIHFGYSFKTKKLENLKWPTVGHLFNK